jgi:hypothetical protein
MWRSETRSTPRSRIHEGSTVTSTKGFITSHSVPIYFALAFAISWGGLLAIGGLGGMSGATWQSDPRLPFLVLAMLAGPSIAGLPLTSLVSGRAGLRELLSRLLRWRVGARWFAIARTRVSQPARSSSVLRW